MPVLDTDLVLTLSDADATALVTARMLERQQLIRRNDQQRQLTRKLAELPTPPPRTPSRRSRGSQLTRKLAELPTPAQNSPAVVALKASMTKARAAAGQHRRAFNAALATAKARHGVTATPAAEYFDAGQGTLVLLAQPPELAPGQPAVERQRIAMTDADCDAMAAAYASECTAHDQTANAARQANQYWEAHPALSIGVLGEPPPVDPAYEALATARAGYLATGRAAAAVQAEIVQRTLGAEQVRYSLRVDLATGELVLGDRPE